jgi:hypothetical protein
MLAAFDLFTCLATTPVRADKKRKNGGFSAHFVSELCESDTQPTEVRDGYIEHLTLRFVSQS